MMTNQFKKKIVSAATVIILLLSFSCSSSQPKKNDEFKIEKRNGVTHIFNPHLPLKGLITLELEKTKRIDSRDISPDNPVFFSQVYKADNGYIYVGDSTHFKIHEIAKNGELLSSFFNKGEGPGELPYGPFSIQCIQNDIWVLGRKKTIRFNNKKKLQEEIKFQKKYRNLEILDANRFIGSYYTYHENEIDPAKRRKCICGMFDRNEKLLVSFLEDFDAGETEIRKKTADINFRLNFYNNSISPMILNRLSRDRKRVFLCLSNKYVIYEKYLNGKRLKVIHVDYRPLPLSENDRDELIETAFKRQPPVYRAIIRENLPPYFCVVKKFQELDKGYLAVYRITGLRDFEIDVFDPEGRYIYQLRLPVNMPAGILEFSGNSVSIIHSVEDHDLYEEYRITNLPKIFPGPESP